MNHEEYLKSVKDKMLKLIGEIENKNIHPIEGIRELLQLRHELNLSNDSAFLMLVGIDSETMDFPVGQQRGNYHPEALARLDTQLSQIVEEEQQNISASLVTIRSRLGSM